MCVFARYSTARGIRTQRLHKSRQRDGNKHSRIINITRKKRKKKRITLPINYHSQALVLVGALLVHRAELAHVLPHKVLGLVLDVFVALELVNTFAVFQFFRQNKMCQLKQNRQKIDITNLKKGYYKKNSYEDFGWMKKYIFSA